MYFLLVPVHFIRKTEPYRYPVFWNRIGYMRIRIQHFRRMRIRIQCGSGFWWNLNQVSEGEQNEILFHLIFLTLNIFWPLPKIWLHRKDLFLFLTKILVCRLYFFFFFGADFPLLDPDPGAHRRRIQYWSGSGSETLPVPLFRYLSVNQHFFSSFIYLPFCTIHESLISV
jgi:hypothetical protein